MREGSELPMCVRVCGTLGLWRVSHLGIAVCNNGGYCHEVTRGTVSDHAARNTKHEGLSIHAPKKKIQLFEGASTPSRIALRHKQ